jgi:hypothetical protein
MNQKPYIPRHLDHSWLYEQYVEHERSAQDIAQECGVSAVAISKALRRSGIPTRPFQGRVRPGGQTPVQKRISEKIVRHAPLDLDITPTSEDLRVPPLRPQDPLPAQHLMLRVDFDWLDPHRHWLFLVGSSTTFQSLARATLAVTGEPFGDELCHYVVPGSGKPPRRTQGPFWRPTSHDIIVPVVVAGDENYGDQLVGSDDTPVSVAVGKGWTFWFHWNYRTNALFTFRVIDSFDDTELQESSMEPVRLLTAPKSIRSNSFDSKLVSIDPIDIAARIARAIPPQRGQTHE